ncbi:GNAT domain-containing protein, partial [Neohortaea acidophila]
MRLNEHQALTTTQILLVPYSTHHVPTYHAWMEDEALRAATASDRLTLEEEYAMQRSWRTDRDKLTFILCLPAAECASKAVVEGRRDEVERMVGDVNLFLYEVDDDDDDDDDDDEGTRLSNGASAQRSLIGELELMIARPEHRRQGYGRAALLTFMEYILLNWERIAAEYTASEGGGARSPLAYLRVRINETNASSIRLFTSVGFQQTTEKANYFGELELR